MFGMGNGKQYREQTSQKISWGHWFAFFNIIWALLIGSRYAFIIDWPHTLFGKVYFFISILGHFSFIVFAAYLLILFPLSFIVKNERTFRGISVIFATICCTLLLVDTEVFSRFNLHLSSLVWNLLVNPENGELSRHWQIFFAPMPLILLAQMLFSRWSWYKLRSLERQKWIRLIGVLFTAMFIATHLIYAWADAFLYRPITMQKSNFPLSYPMTARTFLEKHGFLDKDEYDQKLEQEGRPEALRIDYPKQKLVFTPQADKPNILLITVSGLRYDALSTERMPQLTAFADKSTRFINHYSSGNTNNAGIVGLFYGLNANYTDSLLNNKTPPVLISALQQQGYNFGLFSASGFKDSIFSQALFRNLKYKKGKQSNRTAVQHWLTWLEQRQSNKPWFSYLNLELTALLDEQEFATLQEEKNSYYNHLITLDMLLGQVFEYLNKQDLLQNTLVVLTAEHGYAFGIPKDELTDYFAREVIQVPMIVHWKGLSMGAESKLTSHIDWVPALMNSFFNVKNPISDYAQGNNLFDYRVSTEWVFASNHRWNVIITPEGNQYHLDKKGNYQKYDRTYQKIHSSRPPLGLFLDVFNRERSFEEK